MSDKSETTNISSLERRVSIEFLENCGGYAVKVPKGQKDPGKGWDPKNNTEVKHKQVLHYLKTEDRDSNLGVHFFDGLIDVDIDSDNPALMAALDRFLPPCAHVWGRPSRPRTHRVYQLREDFDPTMHPVLKRVKRMEACQMEVRGGNKTRGEYSLLPGSTHPSGEPYQWSDIASARSSLSVTDIDRITRAVRQACAIALLSPHWLEGIRNDLLLAMSGFLYKAWSTADGLGLTEEGVFALNKDEAENFIEALCDVAGDDPSDRQARMKSFHSTWKKAEKGAAVTGLTSMKTLLGEEVGVKLMRDLYALLLETPEYAELEEFTTRYAVWDGPGYCIDLNQAKRAEKCVWTREQFINSNRHRRITLDGKRFNLAELLYTMPNAIHLDGLTFDPVGELLVEDPKHKTRRANQWAGFAIAPVKGTVKDAEIAPFLSYIDEIVADGDPKAAQWVLDWTAHIFQRPHKKSGTALVLVGIQGSGKSFLGERVIRRIIGPAHSVATSSVEKIASDFNVRFANKLFAQCDEATSNRQKAVAAKLKALITDETITIEPKGIDAYDQPSLMRLLFTSNDVDDAIHLPDGADDRRYTILKVSSKYAKAYDDYWTPMWEWTENDENLAKLHRWFLQREINWSAIARPYETAAKQHMQQHSLHPIDSWLAAMAARGFPLDEEAHVEWWDAMPTYDYKNANKLARAEWPEWVTMTALAKDYALHARRLGHRRADFMDGSQIGTALKARGLKSGKNKNKRVHKFDDRKNKNVELFAKVAPFFTLEALENYLYDRLGIAREDIEHDDAPAVGADRADKEDRF